MSGHIVDYGVWPQQGAGYQSLKDVRVTLQDVYKLNLEESLLAGCIELSAKLLG